jgi:membrane-associated phospholipid phosphatase
MYKLPPVSVSVGRCCLARRALHLLRASARSLPMAAMIVVEAASSTLPIEAQAAGGPIGIDHSINYDNRGIWARRNQTLLQGGTVLVVVAGALWEGDDVRLGHTFWQSFDSVVLGSLASEGMKYGFSRPRPSQTDDPNKWFQGRGNKSFPSGEVMEVTAAITPFVLEYASEHPAAWALELLPLYDSVARVKVRAHWQSDVLASIVIGSAIGAYSHSRTSALSVGLLPHGVTVGWKKSF